MLTTHQLWIQYQNTAASIICKYYTRDLYNDVSVSWLSQKEKKFACNNNQRKQENLRSLYGLLFYGNKKGYIHQTEKKNKQYLSFLGQCYQNALFMSFRPAPTFNPVENSSDARKHFIAAEIKTVFTTDSTLEIICMKKKKRLNHDHCTQIKVRVK